MHLECAFASWSSRGHASQAHKYCKTPPPCTRAAGGSSQSGPRAFWHKAACSLFRYVTRNQQPTNTLSSPYCSGPRSHPASPPSPSFAALLASAPTDGQLLLYFWLLGLNSPPEYSSMSASLPCPTLPLLLRCLASSLYLISGSLTKTTSRGFFPGDLRALECSCLKRSPTGCPRCYDNP